MIKKCIVFLSLRNNYTYEQRKQVVIDSVCSIEVMDFIVFFHSPEQLCI